MSRFGKKQGNLEKTPLFRRGTGGRGRLRPLVLLPVILLLVLAGCQAVDKDNMFEMPSEDLATLGETRPSETAETRTEPGKAETLSVPYQYGNMQINVPSGNFMDYGDKVIFSAGTGNGFNLFTLDKETLEIELLCRDATCGHNTLKCIAYQKTSNLEQYDGNIYVLGGDLSGPVLELAGDRFEDVTERGVSAFWHGNGNLYVKSTDSELMVYEKGSKTPRTLVAEYPAVQNVTVGNCIYGWDMSTDSIVRTDLQQEKPQPEPIFQKVYFMTDGEYLYTVAQEGDSFLYRYDLDLGNKTRMTADTILPASLNFDETYLYFRYADTTLDKTIWGPGGHELYRMPKDGSGEPEKIAELEEDVFFEVFTVPDCPYVFAECQQMQGDEVEYVYYAVAKDGSGARKLDTSVW